MFDHSDSEYRPLSVAPMMDRTDRDFRYFLRRLSKRVFLYTEMVVTGAILRGDRQRFLGYHPDEHPIALQLGGDDARSLAECARIAEDYGYDEVNLNVGCPSDRVKSGNFGACLMARPELVAECVSAMRVACNIPVTVKHRIGISSQQPEIGVLDRYEDLLRFTDIVAAAGCDRFIVHARIAILEGLNPKENREVPPLRYDDVCRLKQDRQNLAIEINGGVRSFGLARELLASTDGVMIGRAAYDEPYLFATADRDFYGSEAAPPSRRDVLEAMLPYIEERRRNDGRPAHSIVRHMLGLFTGMRGARRFRRAFSERGGSATNEDVVELLRRALLELPAETLDARPPAGDQVYVMRP